MYYLNYKYYRCNNCGFEMGLYVPPNIKNLDVLNCKICNSKIYHSKQIEKEWLNERDENGNRKRKIIWSTSLSECIKKASEYFKCKSNEINYIDATTKRIENINSIIGTRFSEIIAWKPTYNIDSKAIKIVTNANYVNGWLAINPIDKIIYDSEFNFWPLKYDKITKVLHRTCRSDLFIGELKLEPHNTVQLYLESKSDIDTVFDILHDDLPKSENEMYISIFFKSGDIAYNCQYVDVYCFNCNINVMNDAYCYIWKDDKYLNICDSVIRKGIKIKLDQIKYYRMIGDKYVTTEVSGGGGGGTSLAGAVVGGMITGGAGAVIGSRKSVESIQSKTTVHDDREVYIYSKDQTQILKFNSEMYEVLFQLLPEKKYETVLITTHQASAQPVESNNSTNNVDMKSKLIELKTMFEEDLITEEEYNRKRHELLEKI